MTNIDSYKNLGSVEELQFLKQKTIDKMDNSYCMRRYASESIQLACKYGYEGVKSGETLSGMYCLLISIYITILYVNKRTKRKLL